MLGLFSGTQADCLALHGHDLKLDSYFGLHPVSHRIDQLGSFRWLAFALENDADRYIGLVPIWPRGPVEDDASIHVDHYTRGL